MSQANVSAIEGNRQWLDGGAMFGNAPRTVWEKWIPPDPKGRIPLACRGLLIEVNGKKVLLEAGIGAFFEPKLAERFGVETPDRHRLLENLAEVGVKPEGIDYVILSHLHFDHAGGLLPTHRELASGRRELVFPRAQFIVGEEAWRRALNPHSRDRASFVPELNELLKESGRLIIYPKQSLPTEIKPYFEFIQSEGHTPGQLHTLFKGPKEKVFFCGDLIPGRPWVHLPITMGYDRFPEKLIDEKELVYERAASERWLLFFTHDPAAAAARVKRNDAGRFEAYDVQEKLSHFAV